MITGDSKITAVAIAKQVGIEGKAITEKELIKMNDEELKEKINGIGIFARTSPNQKLRITKILQDNLEVVAITGDGINDSLALKSADIGISMGKRGSDVAREISDVVLTDDNFASIVEGIKQGRKTYDNIKKFTKYFLAVNFSEILLVIITLFLKLPLPLLPLQILWMNLVTDSFPALSLVFEKEESVMKTKPRKEKSLLDNIWKFIILGGILAFVTEFIIFLIGIRNNLPIELIRTLVLTTAILFELFFVYTCRSNKSVFKNNIFSNKWLNYAVLFSIGMHLLLVYTFLNKIFGVVPLTLKEWIFILPFAISGLIIFEIVKFIRKK
jgi:P-type Ca2+ transporter type 2C